MQGVLQRKDLAEACNALERRRSDVLQRHAQELDGLAAEQADIAALRRLAAAFCSRFQTSTSTAAAPAQPIAREREHRAAAPAGAPIAIAAMPAERRPLPPAPREPWRGASREPPRTNFATFSHALARAN